MKSSLAPRKSSCTNNMSEKSEDKPLSSPSGHFQQAHILIYSDISPSQAPPPLVYPSSKSPSRLRWAALAWAVLLALAMLGPLAALLVYIFVIHGYVVDVDGGVIYTGAAFNVITSLSNIVSKVSDLALVPVVGLMATIVAAEWYRASNVYEGRGRPTPVHLGAAMSLLGGPNPRTLWEALRLWLGWGSTSRHSHVRMPKTLRLSILLCTWLLVLHYGISALDQALHWTTHPRSVVEKMKEALLTQDMSYSRPFNDTRCAEWKADPENADRDSYIRDSCGLNNGSNNVMYIDQPEAARTFANASTSNSAAWTNQGSAIMVPATRPNISYTARALGVRANCKSLTQQCITCKADGSCVGATGTSEASLRFTCPTLNTTSVNVGETTYVDGLIDPATNGQMSLSGPADYFAGLAQANPFRYAFVGQSFAYAGIGDYLSGQLVGDTGFITWGHQGGLNVVDCQVMVVDTVYKFTPPSTYTVQSSVPSSLLHAQYLSNFVPTGAAITTAVQGAGTRPGSMSFADAAALELAKRTVAGAAVLFDSAPLVEVLGRPVVGSTVRLSVLALFCLFAGLFGLTSLLVGLLAAASLRDITSPLVSVIRQRLLGPYGVLLDLYGRPSEREKDLMSDTLTEMFDDTHEGDRLVIGPRLEGRRWRVRSHRQEQAL
ncbi:hypothetical protein BDZ90DRAFT_235070 [Jaminaea rosea]|uniref:Uncharacterized protein n=1 Tax=Jaminaea rosea TaxID=1569628 RepID=A0A316UG74_9BASI|nr:hypothetical protein BDZ90DRAFT_235070 [Jaminaea rosea]PWN24327.1 hypothetical protein BDZ90DRAFT_235070 [Jaminaea rosea]